MTIANKLFFLILDEDFQIFELVKENVEHSGNDFELPAGIVITGGTSEVPEITSIAKKVFGKPARIGTPKGLTGLLDGISSPAYSVVQGLITYAMGDEVYRGDSKGGTGFSTKKKTQSDGLVGKIGGFFRNLLPQ